MVHAATRIRVSFKVLWRPAPSLFLGDVRGTAERVINKTESFGVRLPQPSRRFLVRHLA